MRILTKLALPLWLSATCAIATVPCSRSIPRCRSPDGTVCSNARAICAHARTNGAFDF